jgi:ankyrin repeat protein
LIAALNGHEGCLRALAELGAGESLKAAKSDGATPLFVASQYGKLATAEMLITEFGADVNAAEVVDSRHSPLTVAAYFGHTAVCELLLKHGADPSHKALPTVDEPFATAGGTAEELRAERLARQGGDVGVDA